MAFSFVRKPPLQSLTVFEFTTFVVIGTDYIDNCIINYNRITTPSCKHRHQSTVTTTTRNNHMGLIKIWIQLIHSYKQLENGHYN